MSIRRIKLFDFVDSKPENVSLRKNLKEKFVKSILLVRMKSNYFV